ncbi:MAG: HAMP domain-containing sensor histidine kinase [Hyphomicrobiaceae bacterium]|nr:HAMP domain-containing sensor histidine kinase [Hyphomicrobiaceae bacterium]
MRSFVRLLDSNPGVAAPLIVTLLMIGVSVAVSKHVLNRLEETQSAHFRQLTGAYLDGLSTALHPYVLRRDPWEAFDALDRARSRYSGLKSQAVLVILTDGKILAASQPKAFPLYSTPPPEAGDTTGEPHLDHASGQVWVHRVLRDGGIEIGRIAALIDIKTLQEVRHETLATLVRFNAALTVIFAVLGWLLVRRAMQPVVRLSDHLALSTGGRLEPIAEIDLPPPDTVVGRAYRRFNAAAVAASDREALLQRLADEERRALIGRYASAMAHEVNNPLGGMMNAVRMIQRHGDNAEQRASAAMVLERGLAGIHNVVRASLMTWRGEADSSPLTAADIEDIRYLIHNEASRRGLELSWIVTSRVPTGIAAQPVRQIALNLLLNACAASAAGQVVRFETRHEGACFVISVCDEGPGMPEAARRTLMSDPAHASSGTGGLGLWSVNRIATALGAMISIEGPPGTCVTVGIPLECATHPEMTIARA